MDPAACSVCGRWVRRCKCAAASTCAVTDGAAADGEGLLGVLPTEISVLLWLRCPLPALGCLACVSKHLRQCTYQRELWDALRATWAGGPLDPPPVEMSARTAMRSAVEIDRNWRAGRHTQAVLPLHRCRAHEKMAEVLGADLIDGGRIVVTGLKPATLQVWRLESTCSHLLTHCLRGRACDMFYCLLLPPALGGTLGSSVGRALSQDLRRGKSQLWLWDDVPAAGQPHRESNAKRAGGGGGGAQKLVLTGAVGRVVSAALCADKGAALAVADEGGSVFLFRLEEANASLVGCYRAGSALESLRLSRDARLLLCGARDGSVRLVLRARAANEAEAEASTQVAAEAAAAAAAAPAAPAAAVEAVGATTAQEATAEEAVAASLPELPPPSPPPPRLTLVAEATCLGHTDWVTHLALRTDERPRTGPRAGPRAGLRAGLRTSHRTSPRVVRAGGAELEAEVAEQARGGSDRIAQGLCLGGRSELEAGAAEVACDGPHVLVSASRDHSLRVWRVQVDERSAAVSAECLHVLGGHSRWITGLAVSVARGCPAGAGGVSATTDPIGAHGHAHHDDAPPVPFAVSASADGTLRVWRLGDGACLGVLRGHQRPVTDLDLKGTRAVSGSMDGTVRSWDVAPLLLSHKSAPHTERDELASPRGQPSGDDVAAALAATPAPEEEPAAPVTAPHAASQHTRRMMVHAITSERDYDRRLCLRGHDDFVRTCRFDQRRIISASDDNKVVCWSFE